MLTNSIAHVLQSILQYIALIIALLLYRWIKDVSSLSGSTYAKRTRNLDRHILKGRSTRTLISEELFILYQWIRQLRKRRNLTQEKLAERLGVDPRTVQRWEQGSRPQPRHYSMFQQLERDVTHPTRAVQRRPQTRKALRRSRAFYIPLSPLGLLVWLLILIALFLILRFWLHII